MPSDLVSRSLDIGTEETKREGLRPVLSRLLVASEEPIPAHWDLKVRNSIANEETIHGEGTSERYAQ